MQTNLGRGFSIKVQPKLNASLTPGQIGENPGDFTGKSPAIDTVDSDTIAELDNTQLIDVSHGYRTESNKGVSTKTFSLVCEKISNTF